MLYSEPLGYLLTWTTYGTWLHGDPRGSVERGGKAQPTRLIAPDPVRQARMRSQMKHPELRLIAEQRTAVRQAIEEHCKFKNWGNISVAVRTNHVHVVAGAATTPEKMLHAFKAWSTRALRERGLVEADRPVWTEGGSKRWLFTLEDLERAGRYISQDQGKPLPEAH